MVDLADDSSLAYNLGFEPDDDGYHARPQGRVDGRLLT